MFTISEGSSTTKKRPISNTPLLVANNNNNNRNCIALSAPSTAKITTYNNNNCNLQSNSIICNNNNGTKKSAFYSLTPTLTDLNLVDESSGVTIINNNKKVIQKSLRDLEESRTDNEDDFDEKQENESFLFNSIRKRPKFLFPSQNSKETQKTQKNKNQQKPVPRLVSKDGKCLIRPIHVPNEFYNIYR